MQARNLAFAGFLESKLNGRVQIEGTVLPTLPNMYAHTQMSNGFISREDDDRSSHGIK